MKTQVISDVHLQHMNQLAFIPETCYMSSKTSFDVKKRKKTTTTLNNTVAIPSIFLLTRDVLVSLNML